jgi:hypothetical protein
MNNGYMNGWTGENFLDNLVDKRKLGNIDNCLLDAQLDTYIY